MNLRSNICENYKQPLTCFQSCLTSTLFSPCVALMSLSPPLLSTLYPSQSQLWCMHEGGFPEDQRGHYPGAIRPLVEHVDECWVLLCFLMQPLVNVGEVVGNSYAVILYVAVYVDISLVSVFLLSCTLSVSCSNVWCSLCCFCCTWEGWTINWCYFMQSKRGGGVGVGDSSPSDETLWHLNMKVPESLAGQQCFCLYFTVGHRAKQIFTSSVCASRIGIFSFTFLVCGWN